MNVLPFFTAENQVNRSLPHRRPSFWRLAYPMGGLVSKLPSASVKSLSIIGRNGGAEDSRASKMNKAIHQVIVLREGQGLTNEK